MAVIALLFLASSSFVVADDHGSVSTNSGMPTVAGDMQQNPPIVQPSPPQTGVRRHIPAVVFMIWIWVGSEFLLSLFKRSRGKAVSKDRGSLTLIWVVNIVACTVGISAAYQFRAGNLPWNFLPQAGLVLFAVGIILRWWAIIHLGRFFTTNVAVASDQRVIDDGPYRLIRHPSYTGGMMVVLGISLIVHNWLSILIIFGPALAVQMWRIHIEEKALVDGLGEPYREYMKRTKRLIPWVY